MLVVKKCSFCSIEVPSGEGIMLIRNDGSVQYYCSSKCRKNSLILKRDPRKFRWASKSEKRVAKGDATNPDHIKE